MSTLIKVLINVLLLLVVAYVVPGITISSFFAAVAAFLILAVVNSFLKPILDILTLPINILTLGLLGLILNVLLFMLVAEVTPGFSVSNFWHAAIGLLLYSMLQSVINIID